MNEIVFDIDPSAAKEAVLTGKLLRVRIHGPYRQYHVVEVVDNPKKLDPAAEAAM